MKQQPDFSIEDQLGAEQVICGIDEVGRGPLAGPVVAAAVILPRPLPPELCDCIQDSKKLSVKKRGIISSLLEEHAQTAVGVSTVEEIDQINILQATMLAMQRAHKALQTDIHYALIDGNRAPDLPCRTQTVIKGDQHSLSIAAASIIAKEYRDQVMADLAKQHPHYGWESNAGYGTKIHMEGMRTYGITPHHRRSFSPVSKIILQEKNINI